MDEPKREMEQGTKLVWVKLMGLVRRLRERARETLLTLDCHKSLPVRSLSEVSLWDRSLRDSNWLIKAMMDDERPCLSGRTTSFSIDLSKLTLLDDDNNNNPVSANPKRSSFRLFARKHRRRGSRSVRVEAPIEAGLEGAVLWGLRQPMVSDVSETRNIKRERGDGGSGEKETLCGQFG
ncbi:hypothetical protein Gotur_010154, partial [Gossypium turneri]